MLYFASREMNCIAALICLMVLTAAGCGGENSSNTPELLIPVTGTVLLDGEPLGGTAVKFLPYGETKGKGGFAITDAAGKFNAQDYSMAEGIEPGVYNVTFSKIAQPDGSPIPEGQSAADVGALEILPTHLTSINPDNMKYMLTVESEPISIDYELSSKR
ncbi:carboxypeptidase regulatory-like domain-containing protein [Rubinisphaera italica]|uniref:Carboxypeptidase regulatory-like domain-containing protein n=1 Tax=Rubinisphaera italica TaxID=2527969 RepID=A0A5C5XFZ3_9PLAN|nr:carboxypeptidase regulatory-like domain-containing protein [Rubinisphaera italica]TWT61744.1 hypothetical protein Pan54_24810 [Rubinisphaera italica]